jgi:glycosyltransferase involved in cell wall biosynthesis
MRILQISSAKSFGGGEKHLVDLIGGLTEKGHEVFLAAPLNSPLLKRLPAGVTFLPVRIGGALGILAARQIAKSIREKNIDIVHAHAARDYLPASLAVRFARSAKLVLTRHVLFPMKSLQKLALANVSKVIAVSDAVERQLHEQGIFPAEKIVTVPNGIDISHFSAADENEDIRARYNIPSEAFLIGAVGELKKLKGQEDLILAAEIILQKFPGIFFLINGKDNSGMGYKLHLQNLAAAIGAAERFIWLDWVEDPAPLLQALDIFVSPSHSESFGLAILEAMAAGRAVVATETGGAKELLGSTALVPVEDPVKLASAVCRLLENKTEREDLGRKLQARAREYFALEKMLDRTEKLYLEL